MNAKGAVFSVVVGFAWAILLKVYVAVSPEPWAYAATFPVQAVSTWVLSMIACVVGSLISAPPKPEQVTDDLTFNWRKMRLTEDLGGAWYKNVAFWWGLSVVIMVAIVLYFGVIIK